MIEKLLDDNALISYFSTLVGIIITVILIPFVMNIYTRKKNSHKKLLAEKILMTKLNNHLENIVPNKFRKINEGNIWVEKKPLKFKVIITAHIIPFSIKCDNWEELEKYFVRKFKESNNKNIFISIKSTLINAREDLKAFLSMYGDVFDSKMFREFYILDYNIQTCEYNFEEYEEFNYEIYAENIKVVIDELDKMRNLILKKYVIKNMKGIKVANYA